MCVKVNKSSDLNVCHVNNMYKVHCSFLLYRIFIASKYISRRGWGGGLPYERGGDALCLA